MCYYRFGINSITVIIDSCLIIGVRFLCLLMCLQGHLFCKLLSSLVMSVFCFKVTKFIFFLRKIIVHTILLLLFLNISLLLVDFRDWLICLPSRYDLKITDRFSLNFNLNFKDIFLLNIIVTVLPIYLSL